MLDNISRIPEGCAHDGALLRQDIQSWQLAYVKEGFAPHERNSGIRFPRRAVKST